MNNVPLAFVNIVVTGLLVIDIVVASLFVFIFVATVVIVDIVVAIGFLVVIIVVICLFAGMGIVVFIYGLKKNYMSHIHQGSMDILGTKFYLI